MLVVGLVLFTNDFLFARAVLAGLTKAYVAAAGFIAGGPTTTVLRQILHAGSWTAGGGIHALSVLSAGEA